MRDILLLCIVLGSLPFILLRPQLGVIMWIWISVMNPHRYTWSFAYEFRFAAIIGIVTLIGALLSKDRKRLPMNTLMMGLMLFTAWTCVTTAFAISPADSYDRWSALMKTMAIVFLIPMLFHKKEDLQLLIWTIVLSIGFYGIKGGLWTLATGGTIRIFGPEESYISDNNAVAVAIVMAIPVMRYLQLTASNGYVRCSLVAMMLLSGIAVLGTYSRGALLAVAAMVLFLWWNGRNRLPVLIVLLIVIPFTFSTMPEKWYQRMETLKTYDQDGSARMRLNSWGTMINIAKDRPLTGAGFEVATRSIYDRYAPDSSFPPQVAHSIYFEALGGHGFVGLGLYLFLWLAFWFKARAMSRLAKDREDLAWAGHLALMMQVTLVGFAVGGAFLSLLNFDVPYYLIGAMLAGLAIAERTPMETSISTGNQNLSALTRPPAVGRAGLKG